MNKQIEKTIKNLKLNNYDCVYMEKKEELFSFLEDYIHDENIVSVGGSQTLHELNIIDYLRNRNITFLDRYKENLSDEELKEVFRQSFFANVYITSSNAILEAGYLYNVDGRGNRVAAMIYGPDKVLVIAGINKIVSNLDEAISRVKNIAGPLNAKRLNKKTPCVKTGYCIDCNVSDKICLDYVLIKQPSPNRMTVVLINEKLGY